MARAFSDQRQFLISISGIAGFWNTISGGDPSLSSTQAFDGGNPTPYVIVGNPILGNLTVTRNYSRERDAAISQRLKANLASGNQFNATITQTPTNPGYGTDGSAPDRWFGHLVGLSTPKGTTPSGSSATPAQFSLIFACTKLT